MNQNDVIIKNEIQEQTKRFQQRSLSNFKKQIKELESHPTSHIEDQIKP